MPSQQLRTALEVSPLGNAPCAHQYPHVAPGTKRMYKRLKRAPFGPVCYSQMLNFKLGTHGDTRAHYRQYLTTKNHSQTVNLNLTKQPTFFWGFSSVQEF